jgi:hypothetical protein
MSMPKLISFVILLKTRKTRNINYQQDTCLRLAVRVKDLFDTISWDIYRNSNIKNNEFRKLPDCFIYIYAPLSYICGAPGEAVLQNINAYRTIGFDSVKLSDDGLPFNPERRDNPKGFFDYLTDLTLRDTTGACRGYSLGNYDIYYLYEGLSRPQLAKMLDESLPAWIKTLEYPPAEDVVVLNYWNITYVLRYRFRQEWQFVPLPRFTLPLMRSAGVEEIKAYSPIVVIRGLISSYRAILCYIL